MVVLPPAGVRVIAMPAVINFGGVDDIRRHWLGLNMALAFTTDDKRRWLAAGVIAFGASLAAPIAPAMAAAAAQPQAVIVRGDGPECSRRVAADVTALGGRMTRQLTILGGGSALLPAGTAQRLSMAPCVAAVTPDGKLSPESTGGYDPTSDVGSLYNTTKMIGAQKVWSRGDFGQGVGVALIDTGVAPVNGLAGSGKIVNGPDLSFDSQSQALAYNDEYGHGTHMAGIIAGLDSSGNSYSSSSSSGGGSAFVGVAPGATILNMKVGDESGVADVSQIIAAIDWVVQHRSDNNLNVRVINLSYGTTSSQAYTLDPLAFAAEVAWRNGIVVVTAAGNGGSSANSLTDPAYDPYLIAVGAADTQNTVSMADDTVAGFSSTGNGTRNPDLVAPGVHIASLRDPGSNIDLQYGSTATVGTRFFRGSGTSQATAVVSGAAALILAAHPDASPNQVKYALTATATQLANQPATAQGSGEVNVAAAVQASSSNGQNKQSFTNSTGAGSLDASRGGVDVMANGVALTGEKDIMGNAWNSASMAQAEQSTSAWSGGTFNGAGWSGAGWSGAGWSGAGWSGAGWSGAGWSGAGWSGSTWNGAGWSGAGWSGAGWSGAGWSGAGWSGAGWSGAGWSGAGWSGAGWSCTGWSDYDWS
jgi:serine protease AprX